MTNEALRCVAPSEISDDALLDHARGQGTSHAAAHIQRCALCRADAQEYALLERGLHARLYRRTCPDTLTIGEYAIGMLPQEQLLSIADHLVECPHCAAESRDYTRFLSAPDDPPAERGVLAAIRRLVARPLVAPDPVAAGLRGAGNGDSITYAAEDIHIFVSVQRATRGGGFVLAGMLQLEDADGASEAEARLFAGDHLLQSERIDEFGSFMFNGISPGAYRIEVRLPDAIVEMEPVTVA
jgi:hypothetical protein